MVIYVEWKLLKLRKLSSTLHFLFGSQQLQSEEPRNFYSLTIGLLQSNYQVELHIRWQLQIFQSKIKDILAIGKDVNLLMLIFSFDG